MGRRVVVVTHSSPSLKGRNPANWDSCLGKVKTNMLLKKPGADIQFSGTSMITHCLPPAIGPPSTAQGAWPGLTSESPGKILHCPLSSISHCPEIWSVLRGQMPSSLPWALRCLTTGGHGTRYAFCRTFPFPAV